MPIHWPAILAEGPARQDRVTKGRDATSDRLWAGAPSQVGVGHGALQRAGVVADNLSQPRISPQIARTPDRVWREDRLKSISGNQRGGSRPGAGRKKGSATKRTREIADRAIAEGLTPLEYMLGILRDPEQSNEARYAAARDAAPYVHPKLASVDANMKGEVGVVVNIKRYSPEPDGD